MDHPYIYKIIIDRYTDKRPWGEMQRMLASFDEWLILREKKGELSQSHAYPL